MRAIHAATSAESRSPGQVTHHTFSKTYLDHLQRQQQQARPPSSSSAAAAATAAAANGGASAAGQYLLQLQQQQEAVENQGRQTIEEMTRSLRSSSGKMAQHSEEKKKQTKGKSETENGDDHLSVDSLEEDNQSEIG